MPASVGAKLYHTLFTSPRSLSDPAGCIKALCRYHQLHAPTCFHPAPYLTSWVQAKANLVGHLLLAICQWCCWSEVYAEVPMGSPWAR